MSDQNNNQELIARLLLDRDAEYRRANMAEQQLAELSDMSNIKQELEQKIARRKKSNRKIRLSRSWKTKYPSWNRYSNIWNERYGEPCRKEENFLKIRHS